MDVVIVCCVHLDVNRDEVPGGEAEPFDDFEASQAALAACVRHSTDESVCLWRSEGEPKVAVILVSQARPSCEERGSGEVPIVELF